MAIHWAYAFPNNTPAELNDYGWTINSVSNASVQSAEVYTYDGSPTRYAIQWTSTGLMQLPAESSVADGWISFPVQSSKSTIYESGAIMEIRDDPTGDDIEIKPGATGATIEIRIDGQFQAASAPIDWSSWRYVGVSFSVSTSTYEARVFVDGVEVISNQTRGGRSASSGPVFIVDPASVGSRQVRFGQFIVWDDRADPGETPYYCTIIEPGVDGTNVGTWSPSSGSDDYAMVDTPLDATTYVQNAAPSASDRLQVLPSTDIDTALGTTTSDIQGVALYSWSDGQGLTAKATIGDGTSEASGSNRLISATTPTLTWYMAATTPTGPAWSGSDTPEFNLDIVSV